MNSVPHLQCNLFANLLARVQIAMPGHQRRSQVSLGRAISDRQVQCQSRSVTGKAEAKELIQRRPQTASGHELARSQIELVSPHPGTLIKAADREIRLHVIVGEPNAGIVVLERVLCNLQFWSLCERLLQCCTCIDTS